MIFVCDTSVIGISCSEGFVAMQTNPNLALCYELMHICKTKVKTPDFMEGTLTSYQF